VGELRDFPSADGGTFNYLSGLESLREFGRIVVEALVELDLSTLGCIVPELELY